MAANKNLKALVANEKLRGKEGFKDTIALEGSSRSGKTWSIIEFLINYLAQNENKIATCFRFESARHDKAAVRDFKDIIESDDYVGLWNAGKWNSQEKSFTFHNGSVLEFAGTSDKGKLHGPARDIAWLNEVMEVPVDSYNQIAARTRDLTIMDWNPSFSHHWVFDQILGQPNTLYVHSTYKDNPHLTEKQVREIEKWEPNAHNKKHGTADKWQWEVYGLGQRGRQEGLVFPFWEVTDDFPSPMACDRYGFGLDYGFSYDPTALIECALHNGTLYLREWIYETGLIVQRNELSPDMPSIQDRLEELKIPKGDIRIHADRARPENNEALRLCGYKILPGEQNPGSIMAGINAMKKHPIKVWRGSANLQLELENYIWKRHPSTARNVSTQFKAEPIDDYNHLLDAARMFCLAEFKPTNYKKREKQRTYKGNRFAHIFNPRPNRSNGPVWK